MFDPEVEELEELDELPDDEDEELEELEDVVGDAVVVAAVVVAALELDEALVCTVELADALGWWEGVLPVQAASATAPPAKMPMRANAARRGWINANRRSFRPVPTRGFGRGCTTFSSKPRRITKANLASTPQLYC